MHDIVGYLKPACVGAAAAHIPTSDLWRSICPSPQASDDSGRLQGDPQEPPVSISTVPFSTAAATK